MTIKKKVITALKWVVISKILVQLIRWLVTFWTIRLLTPEDYGLVGLSDFFLSFLWMFAMSGSGAAIIQAKSTSKKSLREFFTAILLMNGIFCILLILSSGFIADIYNKPEIASIINVSAFAFIIVTFQIIPSALIAKEMDFKKTTVIEIFAQLCCSLSILYMAYNGFGFWSLVYGELVMLTISAIALNIISPVKILPAFSFQESKKLIIFGGKVSINSVISHLYNKIDIAIAGIILTASELGQYQIALIIAAIPLQKIIPSLKRVAFPAFAKIQDDEKASQFYLLKSQRIGAYIIFPLFLGIAITADLFVPLLLGEKWLDAIIPITIISLVMPFRFCREMFSPVINGLGNPGLLLKTAIMILIITVIIVPFGMQFGVFGLSVSILIIGVLSFFGATYWFCKFLKLPYVTYLLTLLNPIIFSSLMACCVLVIKYITGQNLTVIAQLVLVATTGVLSYVILIAIFKKDILKETINIFRKE